MPPFFGVFNMADTAYFSQDIKVYVQSDSGLYWEIPVLNAPTLDQSTQQEQVGFTSLPTRRTTATNGSPLAQVTTLKQVFTTEKSPAQWSFSTHIRPHTVGTAKQSVESILWDYYIGDNSFNPPSAMSTVFYNSANFVQQNTFTLYVIYTDTNSGFKVSNCVISSVNISAPPQGLASLGWSGMGTDLEPVEGFVTPGTLQNAVHLANGKYLQSNMISLDIKNVWIEGHTDINEGVLEWGGGTLSASIYASNYGNRIGTVPLPRLDANSFNNSVLWQLANTAGIRQSGVATPLNSNIGYVQLDSSNTIIGQEKYNQYINSTLQIGDQIKFVCSTTPETDISSIYKITAKYHTAITDENSNTSGNIAGTTFDPMNLYDDTANPDGTDGLWVHGSAITTSHYHHQVPFYSDNKRNHINITNFEQSFTNFGVYDTTLSKWLLTSDAINNTPYDKTTTQDCVNSTVVHLNNTTSITSAMQFWFAGIDFANQTFSDSNFQSIKVSSVDASANTITLSDAVTIPSGTSVTIHARDMQPTIRSTDTSAMTHAKADFTSGIWYTPKNYVSRLAPLYSTANNSNSTIVYYDKCGQSNNTGMAVTSVASVMTNNTITQKAADASNSFRIRADKAVCVGLDGTAGCLAANSNLAATQLAAMVSRGFPTKFFMWAPYSQPTYINIYRYLGSPQSQTTFKFMPRTGGGYYKENGTDLIPAITLDASSNPSLTNMWVNQASIEWTDPAVYDNDSTDDNVAYLIESDAPICGLFFGTNTTSPGNGGEGEDWMPLAPFGTQDDPLITDNSNSYHILIDPGTSSGSTAATIGSTDTHISSSLSGYSGHLLSTSLKPNAAGGKVAAFQIADGGGSDGLPFLRASNLGDTYCFPQTEMASYDITPYGTVPGGGGKIYVRNARQRLVKEAAGTALGVSEVQDTTGDFLSSATYMYYYSVSEVDSTSLTGVRIAEGPRTGSSGGDLVLTLNAGNYAANTEITFAETITDIFLAQSFQFCRIYHNSTTFKILNVNSGSKTIQLDQAINLGSNTAVTLERNYIESVDGPFYFEGNMQFFLACQDSADQEMTMLGTRRTDASSSKRGVIQSLIGFTSSGSGNRIRVYPGRTQTANGWVYNQTNIAATAGTSYLFNTKHYKSVVSGKNYPFETFVSHNDGDVTLKLQHMSTRNPFNATFNAGNVSAIYLSRGLNKPSSPFILSEGIFPVTNFEASITKEHTPIVAPILGKTSSPLSFSSGSTNVTGSFSAVAIGGDVVGDGGSKEVLDTLLTSSQVEQQVSVTIGTDPTCTVNLTLPNASFSSPTITTGDFLSFSASFQDETSIGNPHYTATFSYL